MKFIPLTQGLVAIVDDEDYESLRDIRWCVARRGPRAYAQRYVRVGHAKSWALMHRLILDTPRGFDTDHINGDGLDNRRSNLRVATRSENNVNRKRYKNGFHGVSFSKQRQKWRSRLSWGGREYHFGFHLTPEDATRAFDDGVTRLDLGVLVHLNFSGVRHVMENPREGAVIEP